MIMRSHFLYKNRAAKVRSISFATRQSIFTQDWVILIIEKTAYYASGFSCTYITHPC
jgi:hypothetical protein